MRRLTIAYLLSMAATVYRRVTTRLFRRPPAIPQPPPPLVAPTPPPAVAPQKTTTYLDDRHNPNRAERRRFEHARRRHDKFVEAGGPVPLKGPARPKREAPAQTIIPPPPPIADDFTNGNFDIIDKHHVDRSRVLYEESEMYGEFNFRDTILDQLERYFVYLHRMKRDPDAYGFYKQIGATIIPYLAAGYRDRINPNRARDGRNIRADDLKLPPWFKVNRPAFGCIAYAIDPHMEQVEIDASARDKQHRTVWFPKFMYFTKYKQPPPELQMISGGDIYKLTIWWDRPHDPKFKRKQGSPQEYGVFVSADGEHLQVLRVIDTKFVEIPSKREHHRRGVYRKRDLGNFAVPKRAWHFPSDFEAWAKEQGCDMQELLINLFCDAARAIEMSGYSMVRVEARKDDAVAVFGVNVRKLAYFFQDRDTTLNASGSKERVFHMVRAHDRRGQAVKFHFRGLKQFEWAGYHVSITVPGRDHFMPQEIDIGVSDDYWIDKADRKKYMTNTEAGKLIADAIHDGRQGMRQ